MSFDLRVTISGMCLFVRDGRPGQGLVRLLLPDMSEHPGHEARLLYDRAYMASETNHVLQRSLRCVPLDRQLLTLPGGAPPSLDLPPEIVPVDQGGGPHVDPAVVDPNNPPAARVKAHVVLGKGEVTDYEPGAHYTVGGGATQRVTFQVDWTLRGLSGPGGVDRLDWNLVSLDDGNTQTPLDALVPIGGMIHVFIYHVVHSELPGTLTPPTALFKGTAAPHFDGFSKLLTGAVTVPVFDHREAETNDCSGVAGGAVTTGARKGRRSRRPPVSVVGADANHVTATVRTGSPFTCMPGSGPVP